MKALALVLLAGANVLGGLSYLGQALALEGLPPATIALLRNLIALPPMALWLALRKPRSGDYDRRDLLRVLFLGTCAYGLPLLLGIYGVRGSTSANGSILILLEPVTITLIAYLFLKEQVPGAHLLGAAMGLLGAGAIVFQGAELSDLFAGEYFTGNAMLAVHGMLWGLYTPIAKPIMARHDALEVSFLTLVASCLVLAPGAVAEAGSWSAGPDLWPAVGWTAALGLGVSFVGTVLWLAALRHVRATTVALYVFLQPLVGVLAGTLVLAEPFTPATAAGAAMILGGVALTVLRRA
jgi:drug/metabolite transporter (DMT)-like permease